MDEVSCKLLTIISKKCTDVSMTINRNLQFANSRTGVFFADIGIYDHAERVYELCARGRKWTVENVPIYYNQGSVTAFIISGFKTKKNERNLIHVFLLKFESYFLQNTEMRLTFYARLRLKWRNLLIERIIH